LRFSNYAGEVREVGTHQDSIYAMVFNDHGATPGHAKVTWGCSTAADVPFFVKRLSVTPLLSTFGRLQVLAVAGLSTKVDLALAPMYAYAPLTLTTLPESEAIPY
jgi:hypothetical protein